MSHDIRFLNGIPQMVYARLDGGVWHGLGKEVENRFSILANFSQEGINFDYEVEKVPLHFFHHGEMQNFSGNFVLCPKTHIEVFGQCTNRYTILQNQEASQLLIDVCNRLKIEPVATTHMILNQCNHVVCVPMENLNFSASEQDITKRFLTLSNSHDGTTPLEIFISEIRVVCQNTKIAGRNSAEFLYRTRHTPNLKNRIAQIADKMSSIFDSVKKHDQTIMRLVKKTLDRSALPIFWQAIENPILKGNRDFAEMIVRIGNDRSAIYGLCPDDITSVKNYTDFVNRYDSKTCVGVAGETAYAVLQAYSENRQFDGFRELTTGKTSLKIDEATQYLLSL